MTTNYMLTMSRDGITDYCYLRKFLNFVEANDIHKWVIGRETGKNGRKHWQIRIATRWTFEQMQVMFPGAHIEECSDTWEYETKEGQYLKWDDRPENLRERFGSFRFAQEYVRKALERSNDREVVVWYDERGNCGKSWFTRALWERGLAYYSAGTDKGTTIVQDIASEYLKHGWRPYVVIDIPRAGKWSTELYEAIERVKDGLIKDPRYSANSINIHGVKVLVCCNTMPKLDKLSQDRWNIINQSEIEWVEKTMDLRGAFS
uniref:Replication-associated protein n=1 Tax=Syrmaticus ellioti CRESS-DNA-virus sp. TaxID=2815058 RepID=A0A8A4XD10_9VIRU